jgi:hypothetical protein
MTLTSCTGKTVPSPVRLLIEELVRVVGDIPLLVCLFKYRSIILTPVL